MAISTLGGVSGGGKQPKSATFTSSGTWTVPSGVTSARVTCVGAGGTGYTTSYAGGGGGVISGVVDVSTFGSIPVTVGAAVANNNGGDSAFGSLLLAQGGRSLNNGGATTTTPNIFGSDYQGVITQFTNPHAVMPHGLTVGKYHLSTNGQNFTNGTGPVVVWRSDVNSFVNGYRPHSDNFNGNGNKFFEFNNRIIWYNASYIQNAAITGTTNPINGFWYSKSKTDIDAVGAGGSFTWEAMTGFPITMGTRTLEAGQVFINGTGMYYASNQNGIWRTTDGIAWTQVCSVESYSGTKLGMYIDNSGRIVVAALYSGSQVNFYRTTDSSWTAWNSVGYINMNVQANYGIAFAGMNQYMRYKASTDQWVILGTQYYQNQVTTNGAQIYFAVGGLPGNYSTIAYQGYFTGVHSDSVSPSFGDYLHYWWGSDGTLNMQANRNLYQFADPFASTSTSPAQLFFTKLSYGTDAYIALAAAMPANAEIIFFETGTDVAASYVLRSTAGNKGHEGRQQAAGGAGGPGIYFDGTYHIGGQGIDGYGWGSSDYNMNGTTQGSGAYYGYTAKNGVVIIEWWE